MAGGFGFTLGPTSPSGRGLAAGDEVTVEIAPEGPQRDDLADDVAAALAANPDAGAFFDSLAQFYRRAYLRWIDATKRRIGGWLRPVPSRLRRGARQAEPGSDGMAQIDRATEHIGWSCG